MNHVEINALVGATFRIELRMPFDSNLIIRFEENLIEVANRMQSCYLNESRISINLKF